MEGSHLITDDRCLVAVRRLRPAAGSCAAYPRRLISKPFGPPTDRNLVPLPTRGVEGVGGSALHLPRHEASTAIGAAPPAVLLLRLLLWARVRVTGTVLLLRPRALLAPLRHC